MVSNFQIRSMHSLKTLQVSEIPMFNFISRSRILPQFRNISLPIITRHHCLSLSVSPSPSPPSDSEKIPTDEEHPFHVSYLIYTFGWPPEVAVSKAKGMKFKTPEKPDRILDFFKEHGFNKTQISRIVKSIPRCLVCDPEKTLLPKIEFLSTLGLSRTEIAVVLTKEPYILKVSFENVVIPAFSHIRSLVNSDSEAIEMVKQHPVILAYKPEVDNTRILLEAGVPRANIAAIMTFRGRRYVPSYSFSKMVEEVKGMGFDPCSMKFLWMLQMIRLFRKSTWDDKVQILKKYGWSDRDVLLALEKYPKFIMTSKEKIDGVLDFLVNIMAIEATDVANWPHIFTMSLEKRIVPKCLVYRSMMENGLCKRKYSIISLCRYSDDWFLSKIMQEAPELCDFYKEMLNIRE